MGGKVNSCICHSLKFIYSKVDISSKNKPDFYIAIDML